MPTVDFEYVGISVANLEAQRLFYADALGLSDVEARLDRPQDGLRTAILRSPSSGLGVELIQRDQSVPRPVNSAYDAAGRHGYTHLAVRVVDLKSTFRHIVELGATVVSPPAPAQRPHVTFAYVKDPEGNLIELVQHNE